MTMNNYDIDYFIRKFEAIPDAQIGIGFRNHCVLWHCNATIHPQTTVYELSDEAMALAKIINPDYPSAYNVWAINDGLSRGNSPKDRMLLRLYALKARAEAALDAYELRELTLTPAKEQVGA